LGIGDWGLGIGDWGLGPIPNPQSPIPNPQSPLKTIFLNSLKKLVNIYLNFFIKQTKIKLKYIIIFQNIIQYKLFFILPKNDIYSKKFLKILMILSQ